MQETTTQFAKVVAIPTLYTWCQAYSAGSLFVVISLATKESQEETTKLSELGKKTIDALEAEYFSLEVKDLASIKTALATVSSQIPPQLSFSLTG